MKSRALAGYTTISVVHGLASVSEALSLEKLSLYTCVHRSRIHNGQDMEMSQTEFTVANTWKCHRQKNKVPYNYTVKHQLTCKREGIS